MRRKSNLILYLLLNIIVSAATTLAVLYIWDQVHPGKLAIPPASDQAAAQALLQTPEPTLPQPTPTLPSVDQAVIEIIGVIAPGDVQQEVVMLKRAGEGNLVMTGWSLRGNLGSSFTFPEQPELTLYQDGAMQVYSRIGDSTPLDVYLDRTEAAWNRGETLQIIDREGNLRAEYKIP